MTKIFVPKEDIIELYVNQGLTLKECCEKLNIKSDITLRKIMEEYDIPRRNPNKLNSLETKLELSEEALKKKLEYMYFTEKKSKNKIAKELGVTSTIISRRFKRFNIAGFSVMDSKTIFGSGKNAGRWNNGYIICSNGYRAVRAHDHPYHDSRGYVYEHRLVMEKKIGRFLRPDEIVHHINGNKLDNRPENLMLLSNSEHIKLHARLKKIQKEDDFNGQ